MLISDRFECPSGEFFYQVVKDAFAIMATLDPALYGNILITKGAKGV